MNFLWKAALTMAILGAATGAFPQEKSAGAQRGQQKQTAQDGALPAYVKALKQQLRSTMVFRDPVTGEIRAPEGGEHAALAGSAARTPERVSPTRQRLPSGGSYLKLDPSHMEFITATRTAGGRVSYRCSDRTHRHSSTESGGRHEK